MRTNTVESITFDTIDLQRLQLGVAISLDEQFILHSPRLEEVREHVLGRLALTLRGYVWAEPPKSISVRYPSTWWDAFKDRWFPEWAKEAYPVDYTIDTMEGQIFYPKLPLTVPEHAWNLRMVVQRSNDNAPSVEPKGPKSDSGSEFHKPRNSGLISDNKGSAA